MQLTLIAAAVVAALAAPMIYAADDMSLAIERRDTIAANDADREAARAQAEATREAARAQAEATREAARAQAEAVREATRAAAHAQADAARALADASRAQGDAWKRWADGYSKEMRTSMGAMFGGRLGSGRVVKGAPYSAEVVTSASQTLADGNVITRKNVGTIYRDGEGRTRQESGGDGKERTIFIHDPVGGKSYVLTPGSKRAIASSMSRPTTVIADQVTQTVGPDGRRERQVFRSGGTEVRVEDGKVFVDGKEMSEGHVSLTTKAGRQILVENGRVTIDGKAIDVPTRPTPPTAPTPPTPPTAPHEARGGGDIVVRTVESRQGDDGTKREEVRVQVIRSGDFPPIPPMPPMPPMAPMPGMDPLPPIPPMPPMPGIQTMRFESTARLGKGTTTSLGMKEFDGVRADGKMTVWTIPAGEIGNRDPIVVKSESWYAPDLQATVYSRYSDPRTGETVYQLASLRRAEPAADLFKVPEDYTTRGKEKAKEKAAK